MKTKSSPRPVKCHRPVKCEATSPGFSRLSTFHFSLFTFSSFFLLRHSTLNFLLRPRRSTLAAALAPLRASLDRFVSAFRFPLSTFSSRPVSPLARAVAFAVVALMSFGNNAWAVSYNWTGTTTGTWDSTGTNWVGTPTNPWDATNGSSNTAIFNLPSLAATVSGSVYANGITFTTGGSLSGGTINLAGTTPGISVASSQTATISSLLAGSTGLIKGGAGTLTLNGTAANTFTGGLKVNAGTLALDFANLATPTDLINSGNSLTLGGGTLGVTGKSSDATSQTFASTVLNSGASTITLTQNGGTSTTLQLTSITRNAGATLNFSNIPAASGIIAKRGTTATAGFLGAWATVGTGTSMGYASLDSSANIGNATTTTTTTSTTALITGVATSGWSTDGTRSYQTSGLATLTSARSINLYRSVNTGSTNFSLGDTLGGDFSANGFMNAGSGVITIARGAAANYVLPGSGLDLVFTGPTGITVSAPIANNGSSGGTGGTASAVTYSGTSTLTLSGANTYSGGTYLNSGTLIVGNAAALGGASNAVQLNSGILRIALDSGTPVNTYPITVGGDSSIQSSKATAGSAGVTHTLGTLSIGASTLSIGPNNLQTNSDYGIAFGATTLTGDAAFDVSNNGTGTGTLTLGAVGGSGFGITKSGTGVLRLASTNTYSGGLTMNAGTLLINSSTALGAAAGTFTINGGTINNNSAAAITNANNNPLTINADFAFTGTKDLNLGTGVATLGTAAGTARTITVSAGTLTLGGAIAAGTTATGLTKAGAGTLKLSGVNTYTGTTTVSAGTLVLANASVLPDNNVISSGGTSTVEFATDSTLTNTLRLWTSSGATTTYNLNRATSGAAVNQSTGAAAMGNGAFNVLAGTNVASGTPVLSFSGATLSSGVSGTVTLNPTTADLSMGTVTGNSYAHTLVLDGTSNGSQITGSITNGAAVVSLTKSNTGTWTLSGSNSYTGLTTLSGGTLKFGNANAIGGSGGLTVSAASTLDNSSGGALVMNNVGTVTLSHNLIFGGTNALTISSAVNQTADLTVTMNGTGNLTFGNYTNTGAGNRILNVYYANGTLTLGNVALSNDANSYNLRIGNNGSSNGKLNITGVISDGGTATASSFTIGGSSAGNIVTLGNDNTHGGGTNLSSGTLNMNHAGALGDGTFTISGGTLNNTSASAIVNSKNNVQAWNGDFAFTGTKDLDLGTGAVTMGGTRQVTVNGGNLTVGGVISGSGFELRKAGNNGSLTLTGANTYSGNTAIYAGMLKLNHTGDSNPAILGNVNLSTSTENVRPVLYLGADNQLESTATVSATIGGTKSVYTDLVLAGRSQTIAGYATSGAPGTSGASFIENGYLAGDAGTGVLAINNSSTVTLGGGTISNRLNIRDNNGTGGGTLALVKDGAGTLVFNLNSASYTGGFTMKNGLVQVAGTAFGTSTPLKLEGGTLSSGDTTARSFGSGNTVSFDGNVILGDATNNGKLTFAGAGTLTGNRELTTASDVEFSAAIGQDVAGRTLTKLGSGTMTLSGSAANTYTGTTTVSNGELDLSKTAETDAIAGNISIGGGTVKLLANEQIKDTSTVTMTTGALDLNGKTETITSFSNSGGTFSTGAGHLTGTGATVTFSGGTNTVNDGGVVEDGHIVISGGTNTVEGGASGGVLQLNSGGIGLEMSSGATLTLNSDDAVAGKLLLNGGVSTSGDSTVSISSGLALANAGIVDLNAGTRTFTVANGTAATDMAISAKIANGNLTKAGAGTLALSGANTYAGTTTVSAGTLKVDGSLATSAINVGNGSLLIGSTNAITGISTAVIMNGGTLEFDGTLASSSNQTFGALTLSSNSTLDFSGSTNGNTVWFDGFTGETDPNKILSVSNWVYNLNHLAFANMDQGQVEAITGSFNFNSSNPLTVQSFTQGSQSGFEIIAVPEPGTVAAGLLLLGGLFFFERKRLRRLFAAEKAES